MSKKVIRAPHPRRRRKFELAIADLRHVLAHPEMDDRPSVVYRAIHNLYPFIEELAGNQKKTHVLIDLTLSAREATGPGRDGAEEQLLQHLDIIARFCCETIHESGFDSFLTYPDCEGCPAELATTFAILRDICSFALGCFEYTRPRDPFAGKRRARAFEILGTASWAFHIPEALPLALAALKRTRRPDARGAICFLEDYFRERDENSFPDLVRESLLSFAERTDNRSHCTGALNVLVVGGVIDELGALFRLDEWKERHPWA